MMKKIKNLVLGLLIMMTFCIGRVSAAEDTTCNAVSLNELRTAAANIKVSYVPGTEVETIPPEGEMGADKVTSKFLYIKIYNITDKLYVIVEPSGSKIQGKTQVVTSKDVGPDESITLRQRALTEMATYTFTVKSDAYGCGNKNLRTMKLTLPKFNFYSELSACQDIPEYYLCQQYTTYTVDGSTFYNKVDDYKAKLQSQSGNGNGEDSDNTGIISKTISNVSEHKYVVVGVIVAIGVAITVLILRRKRSV